MNKLIIGGGIAAVIAIGILFQLLMSAQAAKGRLEGEVEEAVGVIERNNLVVKALQDANERAAREREAEARRAAAAARKLEESEKQLEVQQREFQIELADIRMALTPEERQCADQPVPDAYFVGLWRDEGRPGSADH